MPKLSKRKRQLKEIYYRRQDDVESTVAEEQEEEQKVQTQQQPIKNTRQSARINSNQNLETSTSKNEDERVWVQCNTCDKWRSLPSYVDPDTLPDIWTCDLNIYDKTKSSCSAPEEDYAQIEEEENRELKTFLKLWAKKLRNADRAESRLPSSATTRGKKKRLDVEWIKCCNASCGKWRAVPRSIDISAMLSRLNKGRHFGGPCVWYCSMNSWDDSTASCAAPQEPLWNCRWNMNFSNN